MVRLNKRLFGFAYLCLNPKDSMMMEFVGTMTGQGGNYSEAGSTQVTSASPHPRPPPLPLMGERPKEGITQEFSYKNRDVYSAHRVQFCYNLR